MEGSHSVMVEHTSAYRLSYILCIVHTEAYEPLFCAGEPVKADKDVQEKMRENIEKASGIEVGTVLGDLKVLAARSFLHLLLAICGENLRYVVCV